MDILLKGIAEPNTRLNQSDHRVQIHHGTFLAKNSYRVNENWRVSGRKGKALLDRLYSGLEQYLRTRKVNPLQRIDRGYYDALSSVVLAASHSMNRDYPSLYGRRSHDNQLIKVVVDFGEQQGYWFNVIGKANEYQENSSWFYPTRQFRLELMRAEIKVDFADNASFLILRDKKKKPKQFRKNTEKHRYLNSSVSAYNYMWLSHSVTLDGGPIIPFCVRIFNEYFKYGGRFYQATHITEPGENRRRILIDGEPTVEPDFEYFHFALMYAWEGIELLDDPYNIEGKDFKRDTVKLASLSFVNSEDIAAFKRNITKSGNPKNKAKFVEYKEAYADFETRLKRGEAVKEPYKPDMLKGFIEGMPDFIQGEALVDALMKRHKPIAPHLGSKKIGLRLQNADSEIMARCLGSLAHLDTPVLPVHDSIRCKLSDLKIVMDIMSESYKKVTGFKPRIDDGMKKFITA